MMKYLLREGEPLLHLEKLEECIDEIIIQTNAKIYLYTAKIDDPLEIVYILHRIDGICITLHDKKDIKFFLELNNFLKYYDLSNKSMRLNIFKNVKFNIKNLNIWSIKDNMIWIKNCPLPRDEVFKRWR